MKNIQALSVRGHDSVLDSVVHHLDEMAGAVGPTVQIALLGCAAKFLAAGRPGNVADSGGQGGEDGIEPLHDIFLAANHHAVAALQTPHTAAGADIDVMNSFGR